MICCDVLPGKREGRDREKRLVSRILLKKDSGNEFGGQRHSQC